MLTSGTSIGVGLLAVIILLTLAAATVATATASVEALETASALSALDAATIDQYNQYEQQFDNSDMRLTHLYNDLHWQRLSNTPTKQQSPVSVELQIGSADDRYHNLSTYVFKNWIRTRRKRETDLREKRDFIKWYGTSTHFQPQPIQSYQIYSNIPYWIPVWGNPRRVPIFFPAKPILFNPGYPIKNRPGTTNMDSFPSTDVPVTIGSRINVNEAGEPIWGIVENEPPVSSAAAPPSDNSRSQKPPTPSLFHKPSRTNSTLSTTTSSFIQEIQTERIPKYNEEPNRCVWAIISCCSPASQQVRYNCFEQLGCPGAFWDRNPCSKEVTAAAIQAAQKFYEQS